MKNKPIMLIHISFIILVLSSIVYLYLSLAERPRETPSLGNFTATGTYAIDSENLLVSINNKNLDVFLPVIKTPEEPLLAEPVGWLQEDYLKIANALSMFVWNESLDGWSIYRMDFQASCREVQNGFNWADFYFYKEISIDGKRYYSVRGVFINPEFGYVMWGDNTYSRPIIGWKHIDINALTVTAEEALVKAEEKGGNAVRLSVNNACHVFVEMYPENNSYYDWDVRYEGNVEFLYDADLRSRSHFRIKYK
ncbi:MAG: hypothetical protein ACOYZ8_09650 [Chloroflexota bacterium]